MRENKFKYYWQHDETGTITSKIFSLIEIESGMIDAWNNKLSRYGEPFKRVRYTGLKDKNSVEIYESDIVKLIGTIGATTTIEFIDGAFYVVGYGLVSDWISEGGEWNNIEKLGNIWENPELLKAKS